MEILAVLFLALAVASVAREIRTAWRDIDNEDIGRFEQSLMP